MKTKDVEKHGNHYYFAVCKDCMEIFLATGPARCPACRSDNTTEYNTTEYEEEEDEV